MVCLIGGCACGGCPGSRLVRTTVCVSSPAQSQSGNLPIVGNDLHWGGSWIGLGAADKQLSGFHFRYPRAVAKHGPQIDGLLIGWLSRKASETPVG